MEIHSIRLNNYKQFRTFEANFGKLDESLCPFSIKFLIGNNGSGKTSVMQAIGLIFTRALNDESPGFTYELIYSKTFRGERIYVLLSNDRDRYELKARLHIRTADRLDLVRNGKVIGERYSEQAYLHPRRVISFASGPNNSLEEVLVRSPLAAINSDIYDEKQQGTENPVKLAYLQKLRGQLLYEPNCINFDASNATFILAALMLSVPNGEDTYHYREKRDDLFSFVKHIRIHAVSFELDEMKCRELEQAIQPLRFHSLFRDFLNSSQSQRHVKIVYNPKGLEASAVRVMTFYTTDQPLYWNPMEFLTMLVIARRFGYLSEVHLMYKHDDTGHLLDQKSLSDGEFLWLSRMALVILSQQEHDENTLFLFDEPDVFLNENWTMQFIQMLHDFAHIKLPGEKSDTWEWRYNKQEYWIATHSTLILTDAFQEQTFMIEAVSDNPGSYEAASLPQSTFAADRSEVSAQLFMEAERIGEYARLKIEEVLEQERKDPTGLVHKMVDKIGPGYERFRLEEYLQSSKHHRKI